MTAPQAVTRKQQRRQDLTDAALRVFADRGFGAARMEDVAEAAEVSKGTIYLYFDSKQALFQGMVEDRLLPVFEAAEAQMQGFEGSAETLLRRQMAFFYDRVVKSDLRKIMRLVVGEGPHFPEVAELYYRLVLSRGQAMFRRTIELGVVRGEFRMRDAADHLPLVLMSPAVMSGMWKEVFDGLRPLDVDAYARSHMEVVVAFLKSGE